MPSVRFWTVNLTDGLCFPDAGRFYLANRCTGAKETTPKHGKVECDTRVAYWRVRG